ncbi:MAG: selenocysteine-specific translation elongation factor [Pyrinomonadaceae bacterium]
MKSIIVGTAGHIDHGKSTLVWALTGKDPDRLPEEKRRGITIDLGFADLDLGDVRIGFVDVPGHERFVKNMLAGAHGIDVVALVIAADEGVMPQTREHFDICRLLGVRTGLIVITKIDLLEEELLPLVRGEAEELVAGSFLESAPVLSVSAKTGLGLDELRTALREVAAQVPARSADLVPRLPVDRAFAMKGFGPVVTGTLVSGEISEGDELELLPLGARVRARGLQVHGKSVKLAIAGQRTAVNLGGIDTTTIARGMVLAPTARLRSTQILDVQLNVLPNAPRSLRSRARVRLHIHAAEVLARIHVLDDSGQIAPGESGLVQLRLEAPVVAVSEERFIIRSYSPSHTAAGGTILDPFAVKHRGKDLAQVRRQLRRLIGSDPATRISVFVELAEDNGQRLADLAARTGWNSEVLTQVLAQAKNTGAITDCDGVFVAPASFERLAGATVDLVTAHHKREPLARGVARETLRERLFAHTAPEVFRAVLLRLEEDGAIVSERDVVRLRGHSLELTGADAQLRERLAAVYEKAALAPPALDEAMLSAGIANTQKPHGRKILQLLLDNGTLLRVQGDLFFHRSALERLKLKLRDYADQHEPERSIDVAAFKDLAEVSRKYAIPLLEFLDRERVTRRDGARRRILK